MLHASDARDFHCQEYQVKIRMTIEQDQVSVILPCENFCIAQDAAVAVQGINKKSTHTQQNLVGHGEVYGRSEWT